MSVLFTPSNFKFSSNKICWSTGIKFLSRIIRQILLNNSTKANLMPVLQQILLDENLKFLSVLCLYVGLSVNLSLGLSSCLQICLFASLPACRIVCLLVWLSVGLSVCLSYCMSVCRLFLQAIRNYKVSSHSRISKHRKLWNYKTTQVITLKIQWAYDIIIVQCK